MRAAYISETGPADSIRVGELPKPAVGPGDVLVANHASALNPIDLYIRSGAVAMPLAFPFVVGCDFAGEVVEVGRDVKNFRAGDRVWGSNQGLLGRQGTAAEFLSIAEDWLYPTPRRLTDAQASSLALVGITAHLGLFRCAALRPGETVFVPGGGGGVGSMVVQMAKAAGARVVATAGNPRSIALANRLGADLVLDYNADDITAAVRDFSPEGVDVWYETRREPILDDILPLLRKRGRLILMAGRAARPELPLGQLYPRDLSILGFAMFNASPDEQRLAAADINRWVDDGRLEPVVGAHFPLDRAAEAHAFLEANTIGKAGTLVGKVVIEIP